MTRGALSPYKGLRMFEDSALDVPFFFGRERERDLVEANLMASRLTVLYGETGVGKSSLLRAGVAHHLRGVGQANLAEHGEPDLAVVVFDAWRDDPVAALGRACAEEVTRALGGSLPLPEQRLPLADALRGWQEILGGDLYVVLDQMEEYFLYHRSESGEGTFAAEFPAVVTSSDLRVNFLLAIREDAVAKLDAFKARLPNVLGNYLRLEHLDVEAAREAIVRPIERYNELVSPGERVELEPQLVDAVLDQVAAGRVDVARAGRGGVDGDGRDGRIETPYLQLVLQRLWDDEHAAGSHTLRLETLERLGGAARIVGDHVARALTALTSPEQDIASAMFDHLVTPSGAKIAHAAPDLARYAGAVEPVVASVLDKLGSDRIVRAVADGQANGSRYEIFHDVLAEPVLAWKAAHEEERALARQHAEAERRHRRLVAITVAIAIALVAVAALAIFALLQRSDARSQARVSRARELAAEAVSELQADPQRSLVLAIASAARARTSGVEDVLRQALIDSRERAVLPSGDAVSAVAFSPDGSLVLTGADDGTARVWRRDGTLLRKLRHAGRVTAVGFGSAGRLILTGSADGTARLWRTSGGEPLAVLRHGGAVTSASFGGRGLVVTSSTDGTARLWHTDGTPVLVVRQQVAVTGALTNRSADRLVAIGGDRDGTNRRARIYSVPSGRLLHVLAATGVTCASFSPDGRLLVTGGVDDTAAVFDAASGRRLHLFADQQGAVTAALFGPGGRLVVTTSTDGATRVFNVRTGQRLALILGHANAVEGAAFSADGRFLVTVSADDTARVWEAATGRLQVVLRGHGEAVLAAAFSPDGRLVATASADGTARLWDPGTEPELRPLAAFAGPVRAASYSPDGRFVLEAGDDGRARLLDPRGRVVRVLRHPAPVASAVFSHDGTRVLTVDARGTLRVWRVADAALVRTVRGIAGGRPAADGRLVLVPSAVGVAVLDARTFERVRELTRGKPFTAAALSPDGRTIATAGADGVARLWDAASGRPLRSLAGHKSALTDVGFSTDGRSLVTASRDHDARVWDLATGASTVLRGHFGPVFGASFSPDGRFVVTAGPITAGLWLASDGRFITYLHGHRDVLTDASFSPDGTRVVTAARDGTLRTYACVSCGNTAELLRVAEARLAALRRPLSTAARERYLPSGADRT